MRSSRIGVLALVGTAILPFALAGQTCLGMRSDRGGGVQIPLAWVAQDGGEGTSAWSGGIGGWVAPTAALRVGADWRYRDFRASERGMHDLGAAVELVADRPLRPCLTVEGRGAFASGLATDERFRGYGFSAGLGIAAETGSGDVRFIPFVVGRFAVAGTDAALFGFDYTESGVGGGLDAGATLWLRQVGLRVVGRRLWLDDDLGPHALGDRTFGITLLVAF
ncbi:MAG: hypothetical protein R3E98_14855 [Gemmatimonadota bacterium]